MKRPLGLLLVMAVALAACGSDDDGGDSADLAVSESTDGGGEKSGGDGGEVVGCEALPEAEAEAFLEAPVEEQIDEDGVGQEVLAVDCVWVADSDSGSRMLSLSVYKGPQFFTPDAYAAEESFEALDGIGEDAFLWEASYGLTLQALKGDQTVELSANGYGRDATDLDLATVRQRLIDTAERFVADL